MNDHTSSVVPGPHRSAWARFGLKHSLVLALLGAAIALPAFREIGSYNYVLQIGAVMFMWVALSSSWNILGGHTGYVSLGHSAFFGAGAYFSGVMLVEHDLSPFVTAPLAGLFTLGLGIVAGLITFRTSGPAFIVATIAMLFVLGLLMDNWEYVGGSNGLSMPLPPFDATWVKVPFYYGMLIAAVLAVVLGHRVAHSKVGLALRAIGDDEIKAEVSGVNTRLFKLMAFALSAIIPGVVGAMWGYSLTYLRPTAFFTLPISAQMVLMVIVGGRGTVSGPVVGAAFIVVLNEISISVLGASELNLAFTGLILILALLFFPLGLVGTLRQRSQLPSWLDWD